MRKTTKKISKMQERRRIVWDLYRAANSMARIVDVLYNEHGIKTTTTTVHRDIKHGIAELKKCMLKDVSEWRASQIEKLRRMDKVLIPLVLGGDLSAIKRMQANIKLEADLTGTAAPIKTDNINHNDNKITILSPEDEPDKLKAAREKMKEQLGIVPDKTNNNG